MKTLLAALAAFLLTLMLSACAPVETGPDADTTTVNQPHLPPPGFPPVTDTTDQRVCSGMVAGELETCGADEFCYIPTGQFCGAADYPGVCRPKPDMCTQQYDPVCGCDGQTYGNECMAHGAGTSVANKGECT